MLVTEPGGRYELDDGAGARGDQRRHRRVSYRDPVQAQLLGGQAANDRWALLAHDISESGVMLSSPELFPVDARLLLSIDVAEVSAPIRIVGRVRWVAREDIQERYQLGVQFEEPTDLARAQLQQLVAKRGGSGAETGR